jgi:anaerobic magnesium-protoporphyrin IX monomethyl ester cyclase
MESSVRLLLINPPTSFDKGNIWKSIDGRTPPLGLALLSAILEHEGILCDICDCPAEQLSVAGVIARIRENAYTHVGLTSVTVSIDSALALAASIRSQFPSIKLIFGGVHPSMFYKDLIEKDCIDFIIRNEGEESLLELAKGVAISKIPNLSYKEDGRVCHTPSRTEYYDLARRPFLAYHKLNMSKYHASMGAALRRPNIGMIVSRGCPGRCVFCFNGMFGRQVRFMPAARIIEEIAFLQKTYGIREINFYDDNFTGNRRIVGEFCDLIRRNKIDLTWSCFARVDTVNPGLLKTMKQSGCHQIMFGIESGDARVLERANKMVDFEKNQQAVRMAQQAGITVRGAFMLGNRGETEETIKNTIDYAIGLKLDLAIFNIATPYPGTELFNWAEKNHYLLSRNWRDFDLSKPLIRTPDLNEGIVKRYYKTAYRRFYLRPGYLIRRLLRIRTLDDFKQNVEGVLTMFRL